MLPVAFIRAHWPMLAYGWLMTFCSGFGQTYFMSIFGGMIRADFGLDHAVYGLCYAIATLSSAAVLLWAGRLIDRVSLRMFSLASVGGLVCATVAMGHTVGIASLVLAFFLLRFFGQGLMIHSAMTAMGRSFVAERGRAVSFSITGHVLGGALLPLAGVSLMSHLSWQQVWLAGGAALAVLGIPGILLLLQRAEPSDIVTQRAVDRSGSAPSEASVHHWTQAEVLRDPAFYVCMSVLLAPSFITTGLIFHQAYIGSQKGWSLLLIATALSAYAVGSFVATMFSGQLVDKLSARRLVPVALIPILLSCLWLPFAGTSYGAFIFFGLMGLGTGLVQVISGAIWVEVYGSRHLGAIRSLAASGSVFSSGLAPGIFGVLLDREWSADTIAVSCAAYCAAASLLAGWYLQKARIGRSSHVR
ncbi:MAG: MFS transporter [Hyphomicrobiaceae bacterium]